MENRKIENLNRNEKKPGPKENPSIKEKQDRIKQKTTHDEPSLKRKKHISEQRFINAEKKKLAKKQLKVSDHKKKPFIEKNRATSIRHQSKLHQSFTQPILSTTFQHSFLPPPPTDLPPPLPLQSPTPPDDLLPPVPTSNIHSNLIPPPPDLPPPPPLLPLNAHNRAANFKTELFAAITKRAEQPQPAIKDSKSASSVKSHEIQVILASEFANEKKSRNYRPLDEDNSSSDEFIFPKSSQNDKKVMPNISKKRDAQEIEKINSEKIRKAEKVKVKGSSYSLSRKEIFAKKKNSSANARMHAHKLKVDPEKPVTITKNQSSFFCCCLTKKEKLLEKNDAMNEMEIQPFLKSTKYSKY